MTVAHSGAVPPPLVFAQPSIVTLTIFSFFLNRNIFLKALDFFLFFGKNRLTPMDEFPESAWW
jgi:hypothetical protein